MNILYVVPHGAVHFGRLEETVPGVVMLRERGGRQLSPRHVLALLAPPAETEDERAMLTRALKTGYRVERA